MMIKFCFNALVDGITMYVGWFAGIAFYNICF
jgi:hypothetical protein